jgi:glycosyltransferase involved in cell wall biosynthesis
MFKEYSRQSARLNSLKEYKAIITASDFMRAEFVNNGIAPEKVHRIPLPLRSPADEAFRRKTSSNGHYQDAASEIEANRLDADANDSDGNSKREWRLLFLGRMTPLKGGEMLLDALPKVSAALNKPLRVTFAGDGKQRAAWLERADRMQARYRELQFNFPGWVSGPELEATVRDSDLLVVPSIWPEPFGLVGPEAGLKMVPAAAFAVGGIGDWLTDGVNGFLAPGNPPTANGLAEAIIKCLRDPRTYARLRAGAFELAQRFSMQNHLAALGEIFSTVTSYK